jgi:hypothetical protein
LFDRLVTRWRFALGARRALGADPVEAIVGDVPTTPEVAAARSEVAVQLAAAQVHSFHRPVLVLNLRSGSVQAVREQLLEAAGRYGTQLNEAATPAGLVALARQAVAEGADVLGVAGGDGSLAAVAAWRSRPSYPSCAVRMAWHARGQGFKPLGSTTTPTMERAGEVGISVWSAEVCPRCSHKLLGRLVAVRG